MDVLNRVVARLAGATLVVACLGLSALVVGMIQRQVDLKGTVEPAVLLFAAVCTIVGLVCGVLGLRLTLNRPNRYQSLLPPPGWYALASVFGVLAPVLGFVVVRHGDYEHLVGAACTVVLALWCWKAGRIAAARGRSGAGTSIPDNFRSIEADEIAAEGSQFGIQIFNDNKTPMEFVVNVLQDDLGMSRESAVAVMLHIHHKGNVLLPVENLSRAEAVAAAITTKARDSGHPLVCRVSSAA